MCACEPIRGYDSEVRHFDELVVQTGESWWGHRTPAGIRRLARRARLLTDGIQLSSSDRVLEIAAGAGAFTETVLRRVPQAHIVATDISGASIDYLASRLREYPNLEPRLADITRLEFEDEVFDAAIGNSALHHVDTQLCLKELFRVLRPGGRLLIFEPNLLNPEVLLESTVARRLAVRSLEYSVEEQTHTRWRYRSMLRRAGFVQVSVRPFDFLHPKTPRFLPGAVVNVGRVLECFSILREISGSLLLTARRPA